MKICGRLGAVGVDRLKKLVEFLKEMVWELRGVNVSIRDLAERLRDWVEGGGGRGRGTEGLREVVCAGSPQSGKHTYSSMF